MSTTGDTNASQFLANVATIVAAVAAVVALYHGYFQFRDTQLATRENLLLQNQSLDLEKESRAVELFVKYNEAMREPSPKVKSEDSEFWRVNLALTIAEGIFKLKPGDKGWLQTVEWMLSRHTEALKKTRLDCPTYDPEFIRVVTKAAGQSVCIAP